MMILLALLLLVSPCFAQDLVIKDVFIEGNDEYTDYSQDANCVGVWRFNQDTAEVAIDTSGSDNHGAIQGNPVYGAGKEGNAWDLDGDAGNDGFYVGSNADFNMYQQDFTICAWVLLEGTDPSNGEFDVFRHQTTDATLNGAWALHIGEWTASNEYFAVSINDGAWADHVSTTEVPQDVWTHIAAVIDFSVPDIVLYMNGEVDNTVAWDDPGNVSLAATIGCYWENGGITEEFDGKIDELIIFTRELSAAEILEIYTRGIK